MDFFQEHKDYKSGFVAVTGRPNAGKSTLVNQIIGKKVVITSKRPQTTRFRITAIKHLENAQIVFVDTPGLHTPRDRLGEAIMSHAESAIRDADINLFLCDSSKGWTAEDQQYFDKFCKKNEAIKTVVVFNKKDVSSTKTESAIKDFRVFNTHDYQVFSVSALKNEAVVDIENFIVANLPLGPPYFCEDTITDVPILMMISEVFREKILELTWNEIPHSVAVISENMREGEKNKNITAVDITIFVERDSQKAIVIGKNGSLLKQAGQMARLELEEYFGKKFFFTTHVKVKKAWRDKKDLINMLGYRF